MPVQRPAYHWRDQAIIPNRKKENALRLVITFLAVMGVIIVVLLISYNWVLQIGHERQCGRIYTDEIKIEECVELRRQGILMEVREKQQQSE